MFTVSSSGGELLNAGFEEIENMFYDVGMCCYNFARRNHRESDTCPFTLISMTIHLCCSANEFANTVASTGGRSLNWPPA